MVGVRTASLSQFAVQTRHRDCNANCEYRRRGAKKRWQARPSVRDGGRPGLNFRSCGSRGTWGGAGGSLEVPAWPAKTGWRLRFCGEEEYVSLKRTAVAAQSKCVSG